MAEQTTEAGYDRHDPNAKFIALLGGGVIVFLVAAVFALQYYHDVVKEQQVFVKVMEPESERLLRLRAREDDQLLRYQYVDREKGTVRIPIQRAMELLAAGAVEYPTTPYAVKKEETDAAR